MASQNWEVIDVFNSLKNVDSQVLGERPRTISFNVVYNLGSYWVNGVVHKTLFVQRGHTYSFYVPNYTPPNPHIDPPIAGFNLSRTASTSDPYWDGVGGVLGYWEWEVALNAPDELFYSYFLWSPAGPPGLGFYSRIVVMD